MKLPTALPRSVVLRGALAAALATVELPPRPTLAISATTMSGKTRPELGVILAEAATVTGDTISGNVVLRGGLLATASFTSKWGLAEGGYYDVEAKSKDGDSAFLQVAALPKGKSLAEQPKGWLASQVASISGRYGAYGAPSDLKVLSDTPTSTGRQLEISFTALSPGMAETPRRAIVAATQPPGSDEALLLVASTSATRWKKGGEAACKDTAGSFRVATRATSLMEEPSADYRYGKTSGPSGMKSRNDGF